MAAKGKKECKRATLKRLTKVQLVDRVVQAERQCTAFKSHRDKLQVLIGTLENEREGHANDAASRCRQLEQQRNEATKLSHEWRNKAERLEQTLSEANAHAGRLAKRLDQSVNVSDGLVARVSELENSNGTLTAKCSELRGVLEQERAERDREGQEFARVVHEKGNALDEMRAMFVAKDDEWAEAVDALALQRAKTEVLEGIIIKAMQGGQVVHVRCGDKEVSKPAWLHEKERAQDEQSDVSGA